MAIGNLCLISFFMGTKKNIKRQEQSDRELKIALSKFSHGFMSNAKWVKLIGKLVENAEKVLKIEFKKVQKDQLGEIYINENTAFGFDYWQIGFEGNNSFGGWLTFREIEYLVFPKIADADKQIEQDIIYIEELIKSVGLFCLDADENRLKLICYQE